jgi:hypothetical protein
MQRGPAPHDGIDRRTTEAQVDHMERRVLDPTMRAEPFHLNGAYAVKTGNGTPIIHADADSAWSQAMIHNHIHGHELIVDRRQS